MNTKNFLLVLMMTVLSWSVQAQDDELPQQNLDPKVRQKVEAARIAFITDRLGLTPDQAEKFWPIYREFTQKRIELRQEFRQAQQGIDPDNPDPQKQEALVKMGLRLRQNEVDLEKDYSDKIMRTITAQQLLNLRTAEQDFRRLILNTLQQRRTMQERKENFRDQNQKLRKNRN